MIKSATTICGNVGNNLVTLVTRLIILSIKRENSKSTFVIHRYQELIPKAANKSDLMFCFCQINKAIETGIRNKMNINTVRRCVNSSRRKKTNEKLDFFNDFFERPSTQAYKEKFINISPKISGHNWPVAKMNLSATSPKKIPVIIAIG